MDATLHALTDPHRRLMLDRLRAGPARAGRLGQDLPISQPAVSKHLKVLRDAGLVTVEAAGRERVYHLDPTALVEVEQWLTPYRDLWTQRLDALSTEIARGKHQRRKATSTASTTHHDDPATHTAQESA